MPANMKTRSRAYMGTLVIPEDGFPEESSLPSGVYTHGEDYRFSENGSNHVRMKSHAELDAESTGVDGTEDGCVVRRKMSGCGGNDQFPWR